MSTKCHICVEQINAYSSVYQCGSGSTSYTFHQTCFEEIARIKTENKNLKIERKGLRDVYDALIKRYSIVEDLCDLKTEECKKKNKLINELMTFKLEIDLVTKQQSERIQTLENELITLKGFNLSSFLIKYYSCFSRFFWN